MISKSQHLSLFNVGFPVCIKFFRIYLISVKLMLFFPKLLQAFIDSISFIYLYSRGFANYFNPQIMFLPQSINLMSSLDVCSCRIFWESSCLRTQSISVSSTFWISELKCSFTLFKKAIFLFFNIEISSSKFDSACFSIFS